MTSIIAELLPQPQIVLNSPDVRDSAIDYRGHDHGWKRDFFAGGWDTLKFSKAGASGAIRA